jgi:hypothetical protein
LAHGEVFGWKYSPRRGPASPSANSRNSQRLVSYRAKTGSVRLITCGDRENPDIPWSVGYQGGWRPWRLGGGGPAGQDTLGVARSTGTNTLGGSSLLTSGTDTLAVQGVTWLWMAGIPPQQLGVRTPLAYLLSRTACAPGMLITCSRPSARPPADEVCPGRRSSAKREAAMGGRFPVCPPLLPFTLSPGGRTPRQMPRTPCSLIETRALGLRGGARDFHDPHRL